MSSSLNHLFKLAKEQYGVARSAPVRCRNIAVLQCTTQVHYNHQLRKPYKKMYLFEVSNEQYGVARSAPVRCRITVLKLTLSTTSPPPPHPWQTSIKFEFVLISSFNFGWRVFTLSTRAGPQSQKWLDQQITLNPTGSIHKKARGKKFILLRGFSFENLKNHYIRVKNQSCRKLYIWVSKPIRRKIQNQ